MAALAPDTLEIRRVYTRRTGEISEDLSLSVGAAMEIVVEWAAGRAQNVALGTAGDVEIQVVTRDVNTGGNIGVMSPAAIGTATDGGAHDGIYEQVVVSLGGGGWGGVAGNMYETIARLSRVDPGPVHQTADFAEWKFFAY